MPQSFDLILVPLVPLLYLSPISIYGLNPLFESVLHLSSAERRNDPRYLESLHGNQSRLHPKPRREMDPSVQKQDLPRNEHRNPARFIIIPGIPRPGYLYDGPIKAKWEGHGRQPSTIIGLWHTTDRLFDYPFRTYSSPPLVRNGRPFARWLASSRGFSLVLAYGGW